MRQQFPAKIGLVQIVGGDAGASTQKRDQSDEQIRSCVTRKRSHDFLQESPGVLGERIRSYASIVRSPGQERPILALDGKLNANYDSPGAGRDRKSSAKRSMSRASS